MARVQSAIERSKIFSCLFSFSALVILGPQKDAARPAQRGTKGAPRPADVCKVGRFVDKLSSLSARCLVLKLPPPLQDGTTSRRSRCGSSRRAPSPRRMRALHVCPPSSPTRSLFATDRTHVSSLVESFSADPLAVEMCVEALSYFYVECAKRLTTELDFIDSCLMLGFSKQLSEFLNGVCLVFYCAFCIALLTPVRAVSNTRITSSRCAGHWASSRWSYRTTRISSGASTFRCGSLLRKGRHSSLAQVASRTLRRQMNPIFLLQLDIEDGTSATRGSLNPLH